MDDRKQRLFDYIRDSVSEGISTSEIKRLLLDNEWQPDVIDEAFYALGIQPENSIPTNIIQKEFSADSEVMVSKTFAREALTMDKIIEKIIPIAGALFLIVGFGYLIYANAWVNLPVEIRIGIGFFSSLVIIGGSFSFSERMRYFTDIGIGSGVLLLYSTLIYGSRATELAAAMIPEVATLFTAVLFTIVVSYFASKRNSKVILMIGMIGAYITPFVIGQNDVWVDNVSFNAYLLYFFAVNVSVFLIGREISLRDIIPLNIIGLFVGVSTLWNLSSADVVNSFRPENILTGELFTAILFLTLVIFSVWSVLLSAKRFGEKDDGYLSLGYIAPVIWFAYNVNNLDSVGDITVGVLYAVISASCFVGWHVLLGTKTRYQHTALYAAGLLSASLAVFAFFQEFDVYTSILIAYSSLIFGVLYMTDYAKGERFISYFAVSLSGSVLSLIHILDKGLQYETLLVVTSLIPAMSAYFITMNSPKQDFVSTAKVYSVLSSLVAAMFVLSEIVDYVDLNFLLFYLLPLGLLIYAAVADITHGSRSSMLRSALSWFALGFITIFFSLIVNIYPAPIDTYLFTHSANSTDWLMINGVVGTVILFLGLSISRRLQTEQIIKRPSFILVIFGFSSLLLSGNYIISAIMNDLGVSMDQGGPRAIATTLWWSVIAIYMLYVGIKLGKKYHSEKLLGLILLAITLIKVILYDIATMGMQNKIIVLMMVGGAMLLFSYVVRSNNMLENSQENTTIE